nr:MULTISPECIES: hypothetical protein [unclassified Psychrosphaera]
MIYVVVAIVSYWLGSQLMPDHVMAFTGDWSLILADGAWQKVLGISAWYFALLPILYWFWVIQIGKQAKWKIIVSLSLSSLIARYTYPANLAEYFEFITWLRYPIIAVLLVIELYLLVTIIKALWQARSLTGDPRIHMLSKYDTDEARNSTSKASTQMDLAVTLAHEPASWYYAIPRFSRRHTAALANIKLRSASRWYFALTVIGTSLATVVSYLWLYEWSELVAAFVATFIFYLLVMFVANYRVSRYYSLYEFDDKVIVNNSWWGFCVISKADIQSVETGNWHKADDKEQVYIGAQPANVKLSFSTPQLYLSGMAMIKDEVSTLYLNVDTPEELAIALRQFEQTR